MLSVDTVIVGGLFGAVIGLLTSDPFRDDMGRYTTRTRGFSNWVVQTVFCSFIGALVTPSLIPILVVYPVVGVAVGGLIIYGIYHLLVDPR